LELGRLGRGRQVGGPDPHLAVVGHRGGQLAQGPEDRVVLTAREAAAPVPAARRRQRRHRSQRTPDPSSHRIPSRRPRGRQSAPVSLQHPRSGPRPLPNRASWGTIAPTAPGSGAAPTATRGYAVTLAFVVVLHAGLSTAVGGWLGTQRRLLRRDALAASLAFAAGLMITISVVEIAPVAVRSLAEVVGQRGALAWVGGALL